ncbi:MAG TPA: ATP-binding protein [Anaerolineales bacterium]|jgi:anti-sigma regulatory factor (Ser/Thr protein kinase)|nr:ATP-binding protein [Anaerolineales bacterium]
MSSLRFAANFDHLDEIREFVGEEARKAGFGEKDIYSIQLATDEAASNVIEHAYEGASNAFFELACNFKNNRLTITLLDHGKTFDPSKVAMPDLKADLSDRKIGGLGIYLMRKLMDEVHYETTSSGNLLTLIKRKG